MLIQTWKISGNGSFHFGRHGLGQEESAAAMASDSLFSALVNRLAVSAGKEAVTAFMAPFESGQPPFALSSTFPFAGDVRLFPVPLASVISAAGGDDAKTFKSIQYVSEKIFVRLLQGERLRELHAGAFAPMRGRILISQDEKKLLPSAIREEKNAIWVVETRPRVTLDRTDEKSAIFFTGSTTFAKDCGLWFGISRPAPSASIETQLENLFAILADSGLGAERNVGYGLCTFKKGAGLDLPSAADKPWINLSRYLPAENEIGALQWANAAYRLVNVGGWLDSPKLSGQRRRAVNLVEEGALLGPLSCAVPGMVVDVSPRYNINGELSSPVGHRVIRSGMALAVGWNGGVK